MSAENQTLLTSMREAKMAYYTDLRNKKEIRSYEVSVWTLQDEFITVLKWSDVEQLGRIEHPKMKLNIDGTEEFTFSIPMYYYNKQGNLIENPNWYNTRNGNLMVNLRKIKVIFNKDNADKAVFEFVISNITETHEKDILTCEIKCEGLAFNELGKIGYKYDLSPEVFYDEYNTWIKNRDGAEPRETLDYWCSVIDLLPAPQTITNPQQWYYKVEMNWSSFKNETGRIRESNKVYEEEYVTAWDIENNIPQASTVQAYREKERPVSINNSNIYNITQTIAETFEIFCRYEYGHDDNNHITSRVVVFYNNFFQEDKGIFSFTYPYSSSKISREANSQDLTTKLFILDTDDTGTLSGECSIIDAENNLSQEDYILNFDYLRDTGTITQEQYDEITPFELKMRTLNVELRQLQQNYAAYQVDIAKLEAQSQVYENSIKLDQEQQSQNAQLLNALDIKDGTADGLITIGNTNPSSCFIQNKDGRVYIKLSSQHKGIKASTITIYKAYNSANKTLSSPMNNNNYTIIYDNDVNKFPIEITITENVSSLTYLYLTYDYQPQLYYDAVINLWKSREAEDTKNKAAVDNELGTKKDGNTPATGMYLIVDTLETTINTKIAEQAAARKTFEQMMGPALREGYWQPNKYNDYGEGHEITLNLNDLSQSKTTDTKKEGIVIWDTDEFDGENKNYYYTLSTSNQKIYYPTIDLITVFGSVANIPTDILNYYIVFNTDYSWTDGSNWNNTKYLKYYAIGVYSSKDNEVVLGSEAVLEYALINNELRPVIVLAGTQGMSAEELAHLKNANRGNAQFRHKDTWKVSSSRVISQEAWLPDGTTSGVQIVRPRIKFSSLALKTSSSTLYLRYNDLLLEQFKHYTISTQTVTRPSSDVPSMPQSKFREHFITIKPIVLIMAKAANDKKELKINYILSSANTTVYLDAIKVSKENAIPKTSYTISPNILNHDLTRTLYQKLAYIVMINDTELKFENVFGYISGIEMDLDNTVNDSLEIKNYKTKFEDLFSTIVAQTEALKRSGVEMFSALNGDTPLSTAGFLSSLTSTENMSILNAYLDSHFDSSQVVIDKLTSLFDEAGAILGDTNKSLKAVRSVSAENASILGGFAERVANELVPKVYKSATRPSSFKVGDVWIQTGVDANNNEIELGRYIATYDSDTLTGASTNSNAGFVRTYDGTLASITGACLDIDADHGQIDINAQNQINIKSGNSIYIAANEKVDIVGNKEVNIGGTTINIAAGSTSGNVGSVGGVNIVATHYNASNIASAQVSKVLVRPNEITMAGSKITMFTGTANSATAAIKIDGTVTAGNTYGVWIGSSKAVGLFSGTDETGSNVKLSPTQIIMGVTNNSNTTVFDLTADYLLMGVGNSATDYSSKHINVTVANNDTNELTGMKLTKDSFGLAIGSGANRTVIVANSSGFTVGTTNNPTTNGSYVSITGSGVEIGSLGELYVNMNNFKLQTNSGLGTRFAVGTGLQHITSNSQVGGLVTNGTIDMTSPQWAGLVFNGSSLYVAGYVHATTFIATGTDTQMKVDGSTFGFYKKDSGGTAILTINSSGEINANQKLNITADNLYIGTNNFSTIKQNMEDAEIDETIVLYKTGTSNTTAPTITNASPYKTADNTWTQDIPAVNSTNKYLWSVQRSKTRAGVYSYGTPKLEGVLDNLTEVTYKEYARSDSSTVAPNIYTDSLWSTKIPNLTANNSTTNGRTTYSYSNPYVWVTTKTVKVNGDWSRTTPELDNSLSMISQAAIDARNIASGATSVPHVEATGISIDNGSMTIGATATLSIIGNHSVNIYSDAEGANNGVILGHAGIIIGSKASIAIAAGGEFYCSASQLKLYASGGSGKTLSTTLSDADTAAQGYADDAESNAKTHTNNYMNGTTSFTKVKCTGIEITSNSIAIAATGSLTLKTNITNQTGNVLTLNGSGITVASGGTVSISGATLSITSTGTLTVDTSNVKIKSNAGANDDIFRLNGTWGTGNDTKTGVYLQMHRTYGGMFAGWYFNLGWIWSGTASTTVAMCGDNETESVGTGNLYTTARYNGIKDWAFYCGASWPETFDGTGYYAPFRVTKNGCVYSSHLCIGRGPDDQSNHTGDWSSHVGNLWVWRKIQDYSAHVDSNGNTVVDTYETWKWCRVKTDSWEYY